MEEFDFDSGIYILEIFKHKPGRIEVGALGKNCISSWLLLLYRYCPEKI